MSSSIVVCLLTPWGHKFLIQRTPKGSGIFPSESTAIEYIIDRQVPSCDFLVVWGGLPQHWEFSKTQVPAGHTIYITEEAHSYRRYNEEFLAQFDTVLTCREDIVHPRCMRTHEWNTWHMGLSLDAARAQGEVGKSKMMSIVCSDQCQLPGQKKRFAFANQLKGHFKNRIDFFGSGFQPIDDKWEVLEPYKYSIAIENSCIPGYFTEKLSECYLAHCMPVYYGAPDIESYFDKRSMTRMDIDDFDGAVTLIEKLLLDDPYESALPFILSAKEKYLEQYHIFSALNNYCIREWQKPNQQPALSRKIWAENTFEPKYRLRKYFSLLKKWV